MDKKIEIIYEDSDLLVINKPAFLVTTKENKNEKNTLEDYLIENRKNDLPRNGIVHRLDKGTSGLILVAKTEDALVDLKSQFKNRTVKKRYFCLVGGDVSYEGEINVPINRSKYGFGKFGVDVDGKAARTLFKLVSKYRNNNRNYSLLDIDLKTGRTHQIRVHFNYLKWPLVGDKLYGGEVDLLKRPFLHSHQITFIHPTTKKEVSFELEMASDLVKVLESYEKTK
ncbi:MAG: RluA family pseudouridine synthase [Candidatus Shapirobacteria bacterium]